MPGLVLVINPTNIPFSSEYESTTMTGFLRISSRFIVDQHSLQLGFAVRFKGDILCKNHLFSVFAHTCVCLWCLPAHKLWKKTTLLLFCELATSYSLYLWKTGSDFSPTVMSQLPAIWKSPLLWWRGVTFPTHVESGCPITGGAKWNPGRCRNGQYENTDAFPEH